MDWEKEFIEAIKELDSEARALNETGIIVISGDYDFYLNRYQYLIAQFHELIHDFIWWLNGYKKCKLNSNSHTDFIEQMFTILQSHEDYYNHLWQDKYWNTLTMEPEQVQNKINSIIEEWKLYNEPFHFN